MAEVIIAPTRNCKGIAEAAGSTDYYYQAGKLICPDVTQVALDAAVAGDDDVAYQAAAATAAAVGTRRVRYTAESDDLLREYAGIKAKFDNAEPGVTAQMVTDAYNAWKTAYETIKTEVPLP